MSKAARFVSTSLLACLLASLAWGGPADPPDVDPHDVDPPDAAPPSVAVVGYVPGGDPAIDAAILGGMRQVFAAADPGSTRIRLEVGEAPQTWSNAAPQAVRLVFERGACVLVAPPDRRVAHLMAQVATRVQVPLVSTSKARSVGATGSHWVRIVPGVAGAEPDWEAVGRRAAREVLALPPGPQVRQTNERPGIGRPTQGPSGVDQPR